MAQRSILSFFSVNTNKDKRENSKCENDLSNGSSDDSPIKTTKKKRQRIESSSSEEEVTNKKTKQTNSPKVDIVSKLSKFSASPVKRSPKKESTENDKKTSPLKLSPKEKSPKLSKVKTESPIKKKEENTLNDRGNSNEDLSENQETQTKQEPAPLHNFFTKTTKNHEKDKKENVNFNPSEKKFHPIENACWKYGEKAPYYALARTLEDIESVSGRLKMIEILSNYLRSVLVLSPNDFLPSIYLCLNKVGPAHEGMEMGLAEATLIRAISQSTGRTVTQIRTDVQETGDLGTVAEKSRSSQRLMFQPAPLTVSGLFSKFREIASMSGQAAVNRKIQMIQTLFVACKGPEARFLIRSLNGKLRVGLAEQSVLQAIALACATTPPGQDYPPSIINASKGFSAETFKSQADELALILKTTYCECPNYDTIVPVLLKEGIKALPKHCKITPGLPMKPMLAQPTKGVQEVLTRFEGLKFTCEWKYDGERAQIHGTDDGTVKIYSRNQEDNTSKYPDIISRLNQTKKESVRSFILDCEAVAWNKEDKSILPFQVLSTRKRKDANESNIKVQVCVFMFDLLYLNGVPLVKEKLAERRRLLKESFSEVEGEWHFAVAIDTCVMEEVQEFLEESIKGNCEGLMVKTLEDEATYEIAKRSRNWLKLKKDYLEGVGDTLDLVVLGGYLGKGKRVKTYGGFLLGCYDEDTEEYQTLCKIGTGFSDESLATHTEFFKDHIIPSAPSYYQHDTGLTPDHWFEPVQVWETKCADLSLSPIHRAALGIIDPEKGISLRFPRFLRVREDKKPEDATTARQIADMYQSQEQVKKQQSGRKFNEEDFY